MRPSVATATPVNTTELDCVKVTSSTANLPDHDFGHRRLAFSTNEIRDAQDRGDVNGCADAAKGLPQSKRKERFCTRVPAKGCHQ